jgi:hypothetical protein
MPNSERDSASTVQAAAPATSAGQALAPLSVREKLALVAEILAAYVVVRRRMMRENDIRVNRPVARRLARAVTRTLTPLPTDNRCLARSLVLDRLLERRSLQSVVVVAVRSEPDFAAHAWVEHDGLAVLPPGSSSFQRLIEL